MQSALIAVGRGTAQTVGFVLIPVALTIVIFRTLVPPPGGSGPLGAVGHLATEQPVMVAAGLLLLFTALVGYWGGGLPGLRSATRATAVPQAAWRRAVPLVVGVVVSAIAVVALGRAYRSARIVSTSMVPTILPGDWIRVDKQAYGADRAPRRGDVVVFRHAGDGEAEGSLVKRVIGLPGDRISMGDGGPVINGSEVTSCTAGTFVYFGTTRFSRGRLVVEWLDGRPYLAVQERGSQAFAEYEVRPGEVFVLGDNRGVSNDSRSWQSGAGLPMTAIEGRVERVIFGMDRRGRLDEDRLWAELGTELHVAGVDVAPLRAGIARCLADPQSVDPQTVQ